MDTQTSIVADADTMLSRPYKRSRFGSFSRTRPIFSMLRRRRWASRRYARSYGAAAGSSTSLMNAFPRSPTLRVKKTLVNYLPLAIGAGVDAKLNLIFDPSATYTTGTPSAIGDWDHLKAIFDQYRVNKITVKLFGYRTSSTGSTAYGTPFEVFGRYCYDGNMLAGGAALTMALLQEQDNIKHHVFTEEKPEITFDVIPYAAVSVENTGLLAAQGRSLQRHDWTDCNFPCQLFGFVSICPSMPAGTAVRVDVTFDISFRYTQ